MNTSGKYTEDMNRIAQEMFDAYGSDVTLDDIREYIYPGDTYVELIAQKIAELQDEWDEEQEWLTEPEGDDPMDLARAEREDWS